MAESSSVSISVRVESDFKKNIDSFAKKYHNGNRTECVIAAVRKYFDESNQEIDCVQKIVLEKVEFILHLIRTAKLNEEKNFIETEVVELWEMLRK